MRLRRFSHFSLSLSLSITFSLFFLSRLAELVPSIAMWTFLTFCCCQRLSNFPPKVCELRKRENREEIVSLLSEKNLFPLFLAGIVVVPLSLFLTLSYTFIPFLLCFCMISEEPCFTAVFSCSESLTSRKAEMRN